MLNTQDWRQDLERLAAPWNAIAVDLRLEEGSEAFRHNAERPFPVASILKVPLCMFVSECAQSGEIHWGETLDPRGETTQEKNLLDCLDPAIPITVASALGLALAVSDNRCANALIAHVGLEPFKAWLARRFAVDIARFTDFSDASLPHGVAEARLSALQVLQILQALFDGDAYRELRAAMANCLHRTRLVAHAGDSVATWNKTGTLTPLGVFPDIACLERVGDRALVVFLCEGAPGRDAAEDCARRLGGLAAAQLRTAESTGGGEGVN